MNVFFKKREKLAQLELLNIVPCMQPHTDMDHLNGQNYTAHSVRFSEMEQNSQKISAHEHFVLSM